MLQVVINGRKLARPRWPGPDSATSGSRGRQYKVYPMSSKLSLEWAWSARGRASVSAEVGVAVNAALGIWGAMGAWTGRWGQAMEDLESSCGREKLQRVLRSNIRCVFR